MTLRKKRYQNGLTLVELVIMIAILSVIFYALSLQRKVDSTKDRGNSFATAFATYSEGLESYARINRIALQSGTAIVGVVNAYAPTIAELQSAAVGPVIQPTYPNVLPDTGGTPLFRVARIPAGCVPVLCDLTFFVGASTPILNPDGNAAEGVLSIARVKLGATAGYSDYATPGTITGQGWTFPNTQGAVAGIFGVFKTYSTSGNQNYVMIGDLRDPNLGGKLTVQNEVKAQEFIPTLQVVPGSACTAAEEGAYARATTGGTVTCSNGIWRQLDVAGVAGGACAPIGVVATDPAGRKLLCINSVYRLFGSILTSGTPGTACPVNGQVSWDFAGGIPVQVVCMSGTYRSLSNFHTASTSGAACPINGQTAWDFSGVNPVQLSCMNFTYRRLSDFLISGTAGTACTAPGQSGWDFAVLPAIQLICKSGNWYKTIDMLTSLVFVTAIEVVDTSFVPAPVCLVGGTPVVYLTPKDEASTNVTFNRYVNGTGPWNVVLQDSLNQPLGTAIAQTYCYYP